LFYKLIESDIDLQPKADGTYPTAKGGTELMIDGLRQRIDPALMDKFQIICSRVRELDPNKLRILYLHDTYDDPENQHLQDSKNHANFAKFVFVSYTQAVTYQAAYGIQYNQSVVLRNAIVPIPDHEKPTDKVNLIYHTTPHRGLELLYPAFEHLAKMHDNLHLDVYSGFGIYGWGARDKPYEKLFDQLNRHPKVTFHGVQPNEIVRQALQKAHVFAYPSIWPETSSIAAIEAMSAGCAVVCSDLGSLAETTNNFGFLYRYTEDPQVHVNIFASVLNQVIKDVHTDQVKNHLTTQRNFANMLYNWDVRTKQWTTLLKEIADNGAKGPKS
jgi:UDP-glucose:(glucosyl)LPS alpha-1,2-glucosyltransferase